MHAKLRDDVPLEIGRRWRNERKKEEKADEEEGGGARIRVSARRNRRERGAGEENYSLCAAKMKRARARGTRMNCL